MKIPTLKTRRTVQLPQPLDKRPRIAVMDEDAPAPRRDLAPVRRRISHEPAQPGGVLFRILRVEQLALLRPTRPEPRPHVALRRRRLRRRQVRDAPVDAVEVEVVEPLDDVAERVVPRRVARRERAHARRDADEVEHAGRQLRRVPVVGRVFLLDVRLADRARRREHGTLLLVGRVVPLLFGPASLFGGREVGGLLRGRGRGPWLD
ncbi:hypothetical protein BN1723_000937 [Verticillium longisporum]|uniref:Uncharacterized protein n=1 Tax=Verticillium longisporum TaxID=100787 RepID=A0A0G4NC79_VERLO|nr:hypothetical protein BN1723_000937 [Verticillium longisporum]